MSVRDYAACVAAEYMLSVVVSVCLVMVVLSGFVVAPELQYNVGLIGVLSALLLAIAYAAAYRKGLVVWGIAGFCVLGAIIIALGVVTSSADNVMADVEENHLSFAAAVVVANACVFLLSRRPAGFLVLVAGCLFSCAFVEFAFGFGLVVPTVVLCVALAVLFSCRSFEGNVRAACCASRPRRLRAFCIAGGASVLCCAAAVGIYALVIAPLDPGHLTLRLFTEERSFETVYVSNPVVYDKVEDPNLQTLTLLDEVIEGNNPIEVEGSGLSQGATAEFVEKSREVVGQMGGYRLSNDDEGPDLFTYELPEFWFLLLALAPIAVVAILVGVRKAVRAKRRRSLMRLEPREQISALYLDAMAKLAKVNMGRPVALTPAEFAVAASGRMEAFLRKGQPGAWLAMAQAFEQVHYGGKLPTGDQVTACWSFHDSFYANAACKVGRVKYCLKYFWML